MSSIRIFPATVASSHPGPGPGIGSSSAAIGRKRRRKGHEPQIQRRKVPERENLAWKPGKDISDLTKTAVYAGTRVWCQT